MGDRPGSEVELLYKQIFTVQKGENCMFTTISRRMLIVVLVLAVFASFEAESYASHSWGGYLWARTSNPFTLKLGDNLTSADWKSHLAQTSSDWNSPAKFSTTSPLTTAIFAGQSNKRCSAVAGTTQVCNGR